MSLDRELIEYAAEQFGEALGRHINGQNVKKDVCMERHKGVDKVEEKVNGMGKMLWALILLHIGTLAGMVAWFIRG